MASAKRAYDIGLQTGNDGNLSSRIAGTDRIIIKPSGYSFGECTIDNLITVNLAGERIESEGAPSRELLFEKLKKGERMRKYWKMCRNASSHLGISKIRCRFPPAANGPVLPSNCIKNWERSILVLCRAEGFLGTLTFSRSPLKVVAKYRSYCSSGRFFSLLI